MAVAPDPNLAERLADAAKDTVLAHRRAIELGHGKLHSLTLELEVTKLGQVAGSHLWCEHVHRGRPTSGLR